MIVITDFDGVLADQREFDYLSFMELRKHENLKALTFEYFVKLRKRGLIASQIIERHLNCPKGKVKELGALRHRWIEKNVDRHIPKAIKGSVKSIKENNKNFKFVIATKRQKNITPYRFIKHYRLPIDYKRVFTVENFNKIHHQEFCFMDGVVKVKTAMLKHIKKEFKLKKSECCYVGDTLYDYKAAYKASVPFVGVLTGYVKRNEFTSLKIPTFNNFSSFITSLHS